jgi:hypothetical protein
MRTCRSERWEPAVMNAGSECNHTEIHSQRCSEQSCAKMFSLKPVNIVIHVQADSRIQD